MCFRQNVAAGVGWCGGGVGVGVVWVGGWAHSSDPGS